MDSRPLSNSVHRFGLFELDLEKQQLRKAGAVLRIQPQPLKVLASLISSQGRIVTREELRRELWGAKPTLYRDDSPARISIHRHSRRSATGQSEGLRERRFR